MSVPPPGEEWLSIVRAPEGLTVVRAAGPGEDQAWVALYSGDTAHDLDVPGMLAALLVPLRDAGVSVFVSSTFHADVVLVPEDRRADAVTALRAAGHEVTE
ncbi:ACT domain-containing protein [Crossiella equi]|uniref:ACT domain-containing protein n=1 Tax=Crossiella equi TaxID=130796 RepID=UPI00201349E9|nr:ACT domain-containing protein [Crossiella equi]